MPQLLCTKCGHRGEVRVAFDKSLGHVQTIAASVIMCVSFPAIFFGVYLFFLASESTNSGMRSEFQVNGAVFMVGGSAVTLGANWLLSRAKKAWKASGYCIECNAAFGPVEVRMKFD